MIGQIVKWGNSLALRIPSTLAQGLDVKEGASVRLTLHEGELHVSPVEKGPVYDIAELAAAITDENNYAEVDFGFPVGSEVW